MNANISNITRMCYIN